MPAGYVEGRRGFEGSAAVEAFRRPRRCARFWPTWRADHCTHAATATTRLCCRAGLHPPVVCSNTCFGSNAFKHLLSAGAGRQPEPGHHAGAMLQRHQRRRARRQQAGLPGRFRLQPRVSLPLIRFIPDAQRYSAPLLLKRECVPNPSSRSSSSSRPAQKPSPSPCRSAARCARGKYLSLSYIHPYNPPYNNREEEDSQAEKGARCTLPVRRPARRGTAAAHSPPLPAGLWPDNSKRLLSKLIHYVKLLRGLTRGLSAGLPQPEGHHQEEVRWRRHADRRRGRLRAAVRRDDRHGDADGGRRQGRLR